MKLRKLLSLASFILLFAIIVSSISSCAILQELTYKDKPLPTYDYPEKVYAYNLVSAVGHVENDNEQEIRALIDMINACKFKEVEISREELDYARSYTFLVDKDKILENGFISLDFTIYNEGKYLRVGDGNTALLARSDVDTVTVYEVLGFDMSVAMPFLEGIYMTPKNS